MSSAIQAKTEALAQASMKLGEAMYKAARRAGGRGRAAGRGRREPGGPVLAAGDEKVVDADFEEVDEQEEARLGLIDLRRKR